MKRVAAPTAEPDEIETTADPMAASTGSEIKEAGEATRQGRDPSALVETLPCLAPFSAFALRFDRFGVCCSSTGEEPLPGDPDTPEGRDAIFNSPLYRSLRQRMLTGENLPRDCRACLAHNTTADLFRRPSVKAIAASNIARMDKAARIQDFEVAYSFANLDNHCNLACRTCSSAFSTGYARKHGDHARRHLGQGAATGRKSSPVDAIGLLAGARVCVEFQGGEPFISPLFASALERLSAPELRVITNGTVAPVRILERLARFPDLSFWFSMDGDRETNARIRHGLDHDRFLDTIKRIADALPDTRRRINFTVSRYNIGRITAFLRDLEELAGLVDGFDYHFVETPPEMRFTAIGPQSRARIMAELAVARVPSGPFAATARHMIAHLLRELVAAHPYDPAAEAALSRFDAAIDQTHGQFEVSQRRKPQESIVKQDTGGAIARLDVEMEPSDVSVLVRS